MQASVNRASQKPAERPLREDSTCFRSAESVFIHRPVSHSTKRSARTSTGGEGGLSSAPQARTHPKEHDGLPAHAKGADHMSHQ